jgi:hypothetical protein
LSDEQDSLRFGNQYQSVILLTVDLFLPFLPYFTADNLSLTPVAVDQIALPLTSNRTVSATPDAVAKGNK